MRRGSSLNIHEQYEELCALAASGQASETELEDLRSHLDGCPSCRSAAYDFRQVSAQALSQLAAKRLDCQIPTGMTQRFVARARSEGIAITRESVPTLTAPSRRPLFASICALAAVILILTLLIITKHRSSPAVGTHAQAPTSQVTFPFANVVPKSST